ncbi:MAG: pyridoxamine 5'-phosphate oxidase family protein [Lachnospiraceae bacterium]|nr:pyridoxamine 5'-phosphate oxidase family protein [Lachnospiraceae bacterium]
MFRTMRKIKQQLSAEKTKEIFRQGTSGVLAVNGDEDYPYAVPLNYAYADGKIYFHGAKEGYKIDAIKNSDKVSFCVINQDQIVQEEYTSYFRSAIAFGRARILTEEAEIKNALKMLAVKYCPDCEAGHSQVIEKGCKNLYVVEIDIEYMSGKEASELIEKE